MEQPKYYRIVEDAGRRKRYCYLIDRYSSIKQVCPYCNNEYFKDFYLDETLDLGMPIPTNDFYADFMGLYHTYVSERFVELCNEYQIKGIKFVPITAKGKSMLTIEDRRRMRSQGAKPEKVPENPPKFFRMVGTQGVRLVDNDDYTVNRYSKDCQHVNVEYHKKSGYKFIIEAPDNLSDIYYIGDLSGNVFIVSERVKSIFETAKITGLEYEEIEVAETKH